MLSATGKKEMWTIFRSLSGLQSRDSAKIITVQGKNYVSPKQKVNTFVTMYKLVSSLRIDKRDRDLNRKLRTEAKYSEACGDFTIGEVKAALKSLNPAKASGRDNIHHLEPKAVLFLQKVFNLSWSSTVIPQMWRVADIRPVPKAGKDQQKLDSFRPISLTSMVGKVMKRRVANRLRFLAEGEWMLNEQQAGFRAGCSTQLLRLSRSIGDGTFTTITQEAKWCPVLSLNDLPICYNVAPKFLGVRYDRQLTFSTHAALVGGKMRRQVGALRPLVSTDWGYDKQTLRSTYIAIGRSVLEYAAAAWLHWASYSTVNRLETC